MCLGFLLTTSDELISETIKLDSRLDFFLQGRYLVIDLAKGAQYSDSAPVRVRDLSSGRAFFQDLDNFSVRDDQPTVPGQPADEDIYILFAELMPLGSMRQLLA